MVDDQLGKARLECVHHMRREGRQPAAAGQGVPDYGDMLDISP